MVTGTPVRVIDLDGACGLETNGLDFVHVDTHVSRHDHIPERKRKFEREKAPAMLRVIQEKPCDMIILGNNLAMGLIVAAFIPEDVRSLVVVVSFKPLEAEEEDAYRNLGIRRFSTRDDAPALVRQLVEQRV